MEKKSTDRDLWGVMWGVPLLCGVLAVIGGAVLNCLVLPIVYIFVHDCGRFICSHSYPVTWTSYFIVTAILWIVLLMISAIAYGANNSNSKSNSNSNSRTINHNNRGSYSGRWGGYGGRETDFFDSDMEGAPGFNGGW